MFSSRISQLTPLEYQITQERSTERPFSNKYNRHWASGTYRCLICNAELFKSNTKFESKSGWPAFSNVVDPKRVRLRADLSHVGQNLLLLISKPDLARTEVSCANCNAHLGHLFKDGPKPTGLRYCINSASLQFFPDDNNGNGEEISNLDSQSVSLSPTLESGSLCINQCGGGDIDRKVKREESAKPVFEKCVRYNTKNFSFIGHRVNFFQGLNGNGSSSNSSNRTTNSSNGATNAPTKSSSFCLKNNNISSPPTPVRETSL